MNFKTTVFILILLLVVGGFFLFSRNQASRRGDADLTPEVRREGVAVFTAEQLKAEPVEKVTITYPDRTIVLAKEGADWWQVKPVRYPLNTWSIKDLIDNAATLRWVERFTPGVNEAPTVEQLMLEPAQATLALEAPSGQGGPQTIRLGKTSLGGRAYVGINDGKAVYVVSNKIHEALLETGVNDWRKKTLTPPAIGETSGITLARPGVTVSMAKRDGNWLFAAPDSGRVDAESAGALLNSIGSIYIGKFVADNPADLAVYGLDKPVVSLTVERPAVGGTGQAEGRGDGGKAGEGSSVAATQRATGDAAETMLTIGGATDLSKENYFAAWQVGKGDGLVVFEVGKGEVEKFAKGADELRDKRVSVVKKTDVREIAVTGGKEAFFTLMLGADGWSFGEPNPGFGPDGVEVARLVESILETKATGFVADFSKEGEPFRTVRLTAIGQSEPEVLRVYSHRVLKDAAEGENQFVVFRNEETTGYVVDAGKIPWVHTRPIGLQDRTVLDLAAGRIGRIRIRHADGTVYEFVHEIPAAKPFGPEVSTQPAATQQAATPETDRWLLNGGGEYEGPAFDGLLAHLAPLRAQRWVKEAGSTTEPAIAWDVTLEIIGADGVARGIQIAKDRLLAETEDGRRFELDQSVVQAIAAEFRARTLLAVSNSEIQRINLIRGGEGMTIERKPTGGYAAGDGRRINIFVTAGLFDTLAGLRAERFIRAVEEAPAAQIKIEIQTKAGGGHVLEVWRGEKGQASYARMQEKWFTLDQAVIEKLTADPRDVPAEKPLEALGD